MKVYGKNVFNELKSQKDRIKKVYLCNTFKDKEIINFIQENHISYVTLNKNKFNELSGGKTQGIIFEINEYKFKKIEEMDFSEKKVIILDHLEDPHNFGAIIRTCEAYGIKSIIIPKDRSVTVTSTVIKASTGAIEHVNIFEVSNLNNAIKLLQKKGYFVYGAEADGKNYEEVSYAPKMVLVIGSEGFGLTNIVRNACDEIISIPMKGKVNSLNASVSAGILIYGTKN